MVARRAGRLLGAVPAPGLVVCGVVGLQSGAALATRLGAEVDPAGVVTLRLCIAAVMLCVIWPPGLHWDRRTLATSMAAGTLLAAHHLSYYEAIERIPLGPATTIEFLGPFVISLAGARRRIDVLWSLLAVVGVALLGKGHLAGDWTGIGFAAMSAGCWAGYILVSARLAGRMRDGRGLAAAVTFGALLSIPYGVVQAGAQLVEPRVLLLACAIAVLSSVLPYSCYLEALRRLSPRVFGTLTSLEPAVAALIGLLVLHQHLAVQQYAGSAAVGAASMGATQTNSEARGRST